MSGAWNEQECKERFRKLIEVEQRGKSNTKRLDKLEENTEILHEMNTNIGILAEQTKQQGTQIKEIKDDVEVIKSKPTKRWDLLISVIITAAFTALVSYIIYAVLNMGG